MASKFQATVVSNEYINAVADSAATGKPIAYSGVVASSTVFTDEQLKTLDYAGAQSANKEITSVVTSSYLKQGSNTIVIEVNLSNENLSTDFQWASVLIYATYNGKNILVAVLRLVTPELFPAYDGKSIVSVGVDLFISVDKTAAANISVNGAGYATMDTVNKLRNYVDNDFNATIIRSDKDGVLNGSYSFAKAINALGGINGALNTRQATFTDFVDVANNNMDKYAGNWKILASSPINNGPYGTTSNNAYVTVNSGGWSSAGLITFNDLTWGQRTYYIGIVAGGHITWTKLSDDSTVLHNATDETADGIKKFIKQIIAQAGVKGNLQGNADTATKLATARKLGGVSFDGTSDVTLPGVNTTGNQNTTGNAATATTAAGSDKLNTGRNISVTGDVTAPAQIFNGTKDLALVASLPTITRSDTSSSSSVGYGGTITVIDSVITDSKGRIKGLNVSKISIPASQTTVTGNAGSAKKLQTARKIGGVSFDGTQDIDLAGVNKIGNQDTTGTSASSNDVNIHAVNSSINSIVDLISYAYTNYQGLSYITFVVAGNTFTDAPDTTQGYYLIEIFIRDNNRTYIRLTDPNGVQYTNSLATGVLQNWVKAADDSTVVHNTGSENVSGAKNFFDVLTALSGIKGDVTGSLKGNADTATRLATARKIGGVPFDGTADIVLAGVNAKGNQDTTGNAATADVLNIRAATFKDISVVTADMIKYSGNWAVNSSDVEGIPNIGFGIIEVLNYKNNKTAGIIKISTTDGASKNYIGMVGNGSKLSWLLLADDSTVVHNTGNETIGGSKTFSSTINGNLNGNSTTATKLATARTIGGVSFDGTQNINLPGVNTAGNQDTSGKAATAGRADTAAKADSATTANDPNALHQSGNESVSGTKTFTGTLVANNPITGVLSIANLSQKDLNSATVSGRYKIDKTYSNIPKLTPSGEFVDAIPNGAFLDVMNFDNNVVYQVIVSSDLSFTSPKASMWIRMKTSNSWGDWQSIAKNEYVVHNIGNETVGGDKKFTGNTGLNTVTTTKQQDTKITVAGLNMHFIETSLGVNVLVSGKYGDTVADGQWKNIGNLPSNITNPLMPVVMNTSSAGGIGGVSLREGFTLFIRFTETGSIDARFTTFKANDNKQYTSSIVVDNSTNWIK